MLPIYKPYIPDSSVTYATDAIKSSWISSIGKYTQLAANKLSELAGCKHAILTNSGTAATHLVVRSLKKFRPEVKRILVPSACYVAAYNSLIYDDNDWDIVCVDLDPDTWNMNVEKANEDDSIFAVHNLGNIINVPDLKERFNCTVIEDNCEGFFGKYNGVPSGSKSLCSSLSFFGNKNITCGEGGAFLTNDESIYSFAMKLRGQGQSKERYIHDEMGYNYRMTNVQAAMLLGQLENIDYILENKKRVFTRYRENLKNIEGIKLQKEDENTSCSMWMFGVQFNNLNSYKSAQQYFNAQKIETRPMFYSYKRHGHLNFFGEDSIASLINSQVVIFPSFPELSDEDLDYVCDRILNLSKQLNR